jgi:hypothetical protein
MVRAKGNEFEKWCPHCGLDGKGELRPISEFFINKSRTDGLSGYCAPHQNAVEAARARRAREELILFLGGKCVRWDADPYICGKDFLRVLQVDHIEAVGKKREMGPYALNKAVRAHPEKFQVLCSNHNFLKKLEEDDFGPRKPRTIPTKRTLLRSTPEFKQAQSERSKAIWADPEKRAVHGEKVRAAKLGKPIKGSPTDEQIAAVQALHAKGQTQQAISDATGVGTGTVFNIVNQRKPRYQLPS